MMPEGPSDRMKAFREVNRPVSTRSHAAELRRLRGGANDNHKPRSRERLLLAAFVASLIATVALVIAIVVTR